MRIKVAVLFGGKSVEHEISVISAIQACGSFDAGKYEIIPIYITKQNEFFVGENIGNIEAYKDIGKLIAESKRVVLVNNGGKVEIVHYPSAKINPFKGFSKNVIDYIDVAFPIVHGTNVEDGTLQGFLQMLNLPYAGCNVMSSAAGMDKYVMKAVLKDNGIPVLDCLCFRQKEFDSPNEIIAKIESGLGLPVVVKPVNLGSSIGITKASDASELHDALALAFNFAEKILVEPAVQNLMEINCAVLGDADDAMASECEEPVSSDKILSYNDKYIDGAKDSGSKGMASTKRRIPADISAEMKKQIQTIAVDAFKCLDCNGVSRIDFMVDTKSGKVWLNEINTIPGSLAFYLWEATGMKYAEVLDKMVMLALKRQRKQEDIVYSFDTNVLSGVKLGGKKGSLKLHTGRARNAEN